MKGYKILIIILVLLLLAGIGIMTLPQIIQDYSLTKEHEGQEELYQSLKVDNSSLDNAESKDSDPKQDIVSADQTTPVPTTQEEALTSAEPSAAETWSPFGNNSNQDRELFDGLQGEQSEGQGNGNTGPSFGRYRYDTDNIDPVNDPNRYNEWLKEKLKTPTPTPLPTPTPAPTPKIGLTGADLAACMRKNSDFIAWITIPGTNVDYPIVQTNDTEYYLDHNFEGNKSSLGTLFSLGKSNWKKISKNIVIYGHDVEGSGKKMFKKLLDYKSEDFYKNHKTIYLDSIYHTGVYEVFAAFDITLGDLDPSVANFANAEEFIDMVYAAKDLTPYNTTAVINENDTIISLVTCDRYFKKKVGRFVIMAYRVSD